MQVRLLVCGMFDMQHRDAAPMPSRYAAAPDQSGLTDRQHLQHSLRNGIRIIPSLPPEGLRRNRP